MTTNNGDLRDERKDYSLDELTRDNLTDNPLNMFSLMKQASTGTPTTRAAKVMNCRATRMQPLYFTGVSSNARYASKVLLQSRARKSQMNILIKDLSAADTAQPRHLSLR